MTEFELLETLVTSNQAIHDLLIELSNVMLQIREIILILVIMFIATLVWVVIYKFWIFITQ